MAMTLRLTKAEQQNLKKAAKARGISMQDAARTAVREWVIRVDHPVESMMPQNSS